MYNVDTYVSVQLLDTIWITINSLMIPGESSSVIDHSWEKDRKPYQILETYYPITRKILTEVKQRITTESSD